MTAHRQYRGVLWCSCGTQIVDYGFADAANPPTSLHGPWLCLFCAAQAARERPGDITQAFTTEPVPDGSAWNFPSPVAASPTTHEESLP